MHTTEITSHLTSDKKAKVRRIEVHPFGVSHALDNNVMVVESYLSCGKRKQRRLIYQTEAI